jgi:putative transposase
VPQGNDGMRIVFDDDDRRSFVGRFAKAVASHGWRCPAYCLMDTHFHAVVETLEPNLGHGMKNVLGWYAYRFNRRHGRSGRLFHGPFWSRRVDKPEHLLTACLYCVLNPVAAGACSHPSAWTWCSFRATAGLGGASFVDSERLLAMLGETPEQARPRYRALVDAGVARLRGSAPRRRWWAAVDDLVVERSTADGPVASG